MNTIKEVVIAGLIVWAAIYAMGCVGLQMDKQTAYEAIRGTKSHEVALQAQLDREVACTGGYEITAEEFEQLQGGN
jgi:hypothetical protein